MTHPFPEEVGPFRLYSPTPDSDGWSLADDAGWLPGTYADRDACLKAMEIVEAGHWRLLQTAEKRHNQARPSENITATMLDTITEEE